jgi:hypothetical protein
MRVRRRIVYELLVLGALSIAFLLLFPKRPVAVDVGLALFAGSLLLLNAKDTRANVWGPPPPGSDWLRRRRCIASTMILTSVVMVLFLLAGIAIGYREGGWTAVSGRILNGNLLFAVLLYLPWTLLQQTLFQFYLLGRIRALEPALRPLGHAAMNGLAFALVHLPDIGTAGMAVLGGTAWSLLYLRYRLVWPLAFSHALVGSSFFYWVKGLDLALEWLRTVTSL